MAGARVPPPADFYAVPFLQPVVAALGLVRELRNFDSLRVRILERAYGLPATGIAGHQTEIIDYDLGGERRLQT